MDFYGNSIDLSILLSLLNDLGKKEWRNNILWDAYIVKLPNQFSTIINFGFNVQKRTRRVTDK